MRKAGLIVITLLSLSFLSSINDARSESSEPQITVTKLASLGDTDRWIVHIRNDDGEESIINIEGKKSELTLVEAQVQTLGMAEATSGGNHIVQQDVLLGAKYYWTYEFNVLGYPVKLFEFNLDIGFPVRIDMQYSDPMIRGGSYPVYATLTPLDWTNYDEFKCDFSVVGFRLFHAKRSYTTPFGLANSWNMEFGPYYFLYNIPIILPLPFLDVGLTVEPRLFSNRIDALAKVFGDGELVGGALTLNGEWVKLLSWNTSGQTRQFTVSAGDYSSLDCSSIILSQLRLYIDSLRVDFDVALLAHDPFYLVTLSGGFPLFYLDFSHMIPPNVFGTHPESPVSEIRVDVPVTELTNVVPEVPWGTAMASASMIIALIAYVTMPKWRRKRKCLNS
ncbi:hypothetical protein KAU88_09895 [Candidatus Bathyarchaeota archaeon]|nr:hypothetical protein [Candidatus Bathyarchaeota archaeon]